MAEKMTHSFYFYNFLSWSDASHSAQLKNEMSMENSQNSLHEFLSATLG
jgi:hypothetical protein